MKRMKFFKNYPLVCVLVLTFVLFTAASFLRRDLYKDYEDSDIMTPEIAAMFQGIKDGIYPWSVNEDTMTMGQAENAETEASPSGETSPVTDSKGQSDLDHSGSMISGNDGEDSQETEAQSGVSQNGLSANNVSQNGISGNGLTEENAPDSGAESEAGTEENGEASETESGQEDQTESESENTELVLEFSQVDESYLEDALFIGDSRTQGLYEYGGLEDTADFYCQTSLTIYDIFSKPKKVAYLEKGGPKITIEEALSQKQFGKIYLMLGINEMGTGTAETFLEEYYRVVKHIQELQPQAIIYVQGIMKVGAEKNATDPTFNNTNIEIRNTGISMFQDNQNIFYLDPNEVLCGEDGNLNGDWTFDQVHLKAKYYQIWKDYILSHAIVRDQTS